MHSLFQEFKTFAVKGNVVDLAIAVIIGTAFGKIVSSLVDTMFMPLIGMFLGGLDFTAFAVSLGHVSLQYGKFVQSIIDFIIIAFVVFLAMKGINHLKDEPKEEAKPAEPSEEVKLLREIRDSLKR
jgi:large conductance mechanosensitive channel